MRFIIVKTARDPHKQWAHDMGFENYRVTCAPFDVFVMSRNVDDLKVQIRTAFPGCTFSDEPDENDCPGHVASVLDPKICGRCGVHIDTLRPPECL